MGISRTKTFAPFEVIMVQIYLFWFLGVTFGIVAIIEMIVVFHRLYTWSSSVKKNVILAVLFAVATIGCMSTAVLSVVNKVVSSDVSSVSVGQSVGEKAGNFSGAVYKGFKEEITKTIEKMKPDSSEMNE